MPSYAKAMLDLLEADSVGVFNLPEADLTGWCLNIARQTSKPDRCITLYDSGGKPPNPQWLVDYKTVQVTLRGGENDYLELVGKCDAVKNTLLGLNSQIINNEYWVSVSMLSEATFLGYDENRRPSFSQNFKLIINPSTGKYRESL